jgi:hypothetical protein
LAISIRASPAHPPLSVRGLVRDLARSGLVSVLASTHVHSSLTEAVPPALNEFITDESCGVKQTAPSDKPILRIALIWKNGKSTLFFSYRSQKCHSLQMCYSNSELLFADLSRIQNSG